jgi:hypothetical protein
MYRCARNCVTSTAAISAAINSEVLVNPSPTFAARKSADVSPTVVDMILMTQKRSATSGTLLSMVPAMRRAGGCRWMPVSGVVLG